MDATVEATGPAPAQLVLEHRPRIYRYLLRLTRDPTPPRT